MSEDQPITYSPYMTRSVGPELDNERAEEEQVEVVEIPAAELAELRNERDDARAAFWKTKRQASLGERQRRKLQSDLAKTRNELEELREDRTRLNAEEAFKLLVFDNSNNCWRVALAVDSSVLRPECYTLREAIDAAKEVSNG